MKLFFAPGACSLAPHICLREAGLKFDLEKVDLTKKKWSGGDFYQINPKGYVPALQLDGGEILTEVIAILEYIADQDSKKSLLPPAGTLDRYRAIEWLAYISTEIHKGFGPLWDSTASPEVKEKAVQRLSKRFDTLAEALKNRPFLMGEKFSATDAYLVTVLGWSKWVKLDLGPWPALVSYLERGQSHPTVRASIDAERALK